MPVAAMKTSTSPTIRPVQRCNDNTRRCIAARLDFPRAGTAEAPTPPPPAKAIAAAGGSACRRESLNLLLSGIEAPQRCVHEFVRVGLFGFHALVAWGERGEY